MAVPELLRQLQAVTVGQGDLHRHHVRPYRGDHAGRVGRRQAFGHNLDVGMLGYELAQAVAGERVPINDSKTNWHSDFPHPEHVQPGYRRQHREVTERQPANERPRR